MPPRLPLGSQRLVIVTGKGGVGKTTVAAALALAVAGAGRRVLAVEIGAGRLGTLLGASTLGPDPMRTRSGIEAARILPEEALGHFVNGLLRFQLLSRRLLGSTTFQVLAAAAPGLPEFLALHRIHGWLDRRRLLRPVWDLVVVDAPASGHSLPLLAAPRTLGALAGIGPVADLLAGYGRTLADAAVTLVCPVTTPEELAVRETVELHGELTRTLGLPVAPPIVNALPPKRFSEADAATLARLDAAHPHVVAARFLLERRRQAETQRAVLRHAVGGGSVSLRYLFGALEDPEHLAPLARDLSAAAGLAA